MSQAISGGHLTLAEDLTLSRLGYGAMQLAGPGVWGPPSDPAEAVAVLREAVRLGVTHIDTSDFYGPHTVNQVIREALHPYPETLRIVTKVGARRGADKSWIMNREPADLVAQVHDNLRNLGVDVLDVVNLRVGASAGPVPGSIAEPFTAVAQLQEKGLIRHLGVSSVTPEQLEEARAIAPVVCVQNQYNIAHRVDDPLVDRCAELGIAYVPFFPLGGFSPLQSQVLDQVAARVGASARQVALAWLLRRSPAILLIPGTSSVAHLRENLAAGEIELSDVDYAELSAIG
ncbi:MULTISPECIES: oxidoreductase [unclassified Crossiella]|uniref:oxidoreductase n=1 Tax=unclassified Crossiella TaxID=2620835 RepID=UPI002000447F|nr:MULTISPECIES: oxidoreductase [unclassified Crossiella]MCK2243465.1 oxidoreductase [Crossiella sp. S99.2]MCK2257323.1 oxidoreductase [Crossiella sp. S99.1]